MMTTKNKVFIGLQYENCYLVRGELTFFLQNWQVVAGVILGQKCIWLSDAGLNYSLFFQKNVSSKAV